MNHEEDNPLAPAASPDTPPLPADARLIARSLDALRAVTARCTPAQAAEAFAEEGARLLGAASGYVAVPVDGGESLECVACFGCSETISAQWKRLRASLPLPICEALTRHCTVLLDTRSERVLSRYPLLRGLREGSGLAALLVFPLLIGDEVLAVAGFAFTRMPRATAAWGARTEALRREGAYALERARLVQEARRAQGDAAAARAALRQQRQFYDALQETQSASQRALRDAQRRLTFHVTNSPLAAIEWDQGGRITFWSPGAERLFGWTAADALGTPIRALGLTRTEDEDHVRSVLKRLFQGEDRNVSLSRNYTKAGAARTCRWYNSALRDDSGVLVSVLSLVQDVTDQTQTEQALRESEARFRRLVETANEGICVLTTEGIIEYANPRLSEMLGLSTADMCGQRLETFVGPAEPGGAVTDVELRGRHGLRRWAMRSTSEITTETGRVIGVLATFTDITDRKRAEEEREAILAENARLLARVREAASFQRTFLRDMLASVTDGRLRLCDSEKDLPEPLPTPSTPEGTRLQVDTLRTLRRGISEVAHQIFMPELRWRDLMIGAGEAAMNAVVHAGGGNAQIYSDPARCAMQVWVRDNGAGIALDQLHRATLEPGFTTAGSLGHGFFLMLCTCDRVYLHTGPDGTTVVLEQGGRALLSRGLPARLPVF